MNHIKRPFQPIENYGIIGNLRTVALVSLDGSIDFMCAPKFDSPSVFATMLDRQKGGFCALEPELEDFTTKQLYFPGTAILLTRFFADTGIAELTDFMPISTEHNSSTSAIVRQIKTIRGSIKFKFSCVPRFGYSESNYEVTNQKDHVIFDCPKEDLKIKVSADVPLTIRKQNGYAEFMLEESETATIVLEFLKPNEEGEQLSYYIDKAYHETKDFWVKWINKTSYKGHYSELIRRSAITLKLLTSAECGSVVAAPTFGLPETLGGNRNWDYRFTWIRDAAFTMYAFLSLGYYDEATAFIDWIFNLCQKIDLQLIYQIDGNPHIEEQELKHFEGYRKSKPVRIGNAAANQVQIDIYGELIDTIYIYNKSYKPITYQFWTIIEKQIAQVIKNWKNPDHGIWEIRNAEKEFLHTRLMCWVAMDRAIKIADDRSFPYPEQEWHEIRSEIYKDIYHNFWNEKLGAWVQYKGAEQVDASALLMPLTHFISPLEPRWLSTMKVIEKELLLDVLVYRYKNGDDSFDGLDGEEGTFNMCSFWFIESLAKSGELDKAVEYFEKMISYSNHLLLFSEELGRKGEHLGNFPQAFTHLALISAAVELNKQLNRQVVKG
ncbi:pentatricopeptide repeat protein [Pedobacter psychrotolerans]|uniref:Glucoamylase n=1 Tax=Pedobacter psychrotolerans TaxID=1843235 RepID=A0A4R2HCN4_9SPHI|nr:glycoside hydrolase family 15 protein [Pedobacter psychrotolerans]TCO24991.1 pentatricopeptide repeat protein [Pedobacter psychrotolerans]GGE48909.1 glucoamylase [Pedobacter psychrotolerans]